MNPLKEIKKGVPEIAKALNYIIELLEENNKILDRINESRNKAEDKEHSKADN